MIENQNDNDITQQSLDFDNKIQNHQINKPNQIQSDSVDTLVATTQSITPPAGTMANLYLVHFGKILSNLSIACVVLSALCLMSGLITITYYLLAIVIMAGVIIFTIGTIFLTKPDFIPWLFSGSEAISKFTEIAYSAIPYLLGVAVATAVVSTVLLVLDKHQKHTGRIVTASIMIAIALILGILLATGMVKIV